MKGYNLYRITDTSRIYSNGVHHAKGWSSATNGRLLFAVRREYSPELEGKTIDKTGAEINCKYPDIWGVQGMDDTVTAVYKLTAEGLRAARKNSKNNAAPKRDQRVYIYGHFFQWKDFEKFWAFCLDEGIEAMEVFSDRTAHACNQTARAVIVQEKIPCALSDIVCELSL